MATGVASPMAQGQATSSRATALRTALPKSPAASHQIRKVTSEPARMTGTKTPLIRSATCCSGALSRWASSTSLCRRASTDSAATALTRTTRTPPPLRVPPVTTLPGPCSTGSGSPVSIDSSTADQPLTTSPSSGTVSPARTRIEGADGDALRGHQLPAVVLGAAHHPRRRGPQPEQRVHGPSRPLPGPGLDGPAGDQDGHDQRRHHPMQAGGELAPAAEVVVLPVQGDGLHRADGQRGQRPQGDQRVHGRRPPPGQAGRRLQKGPAPGELHHHGQCQNVQPSTALPPSGATSEMTRAARARGQEMAARSAQWSERSRSPSAPSSSTGAAE